MDIPVVRSGILIRRMGGKINNKKEPRKSGGWAKQWCTRGRKRLRDQSRHTDTIQRFWVSTTPMLPRYLLITLGEALHTPVYHPNKALCILDLKFISRRFLFPIFILPIWKEKPNGQFPPFNTVELFWAVLQPSSVPFDDNGSERMGTLLRLGIAVKSIWRRPSPFYPARTSSALESCSFLARLPSSPQVVSEPHPPAICCWLGFPPEILGEKKDP